MDGQALTDAETAARRAAELMETDPSAEHTLASLSGAVALSPGHLQRTFKRVFGVTPAAYLRAVRLGTMREALREGSTVAKAGYDAGFGSDRALYEHSSRALGMPPSLYRRGGQGLTLRWTVGKSRLGSLVVAATERGVCCALFAPDEGSAAQVLRDEFAAAALVRDDDAVRTHCERIVAMVDGADVSGDVPLDLLGTAFQRKVWAELRRIPRGQTVTYSELALRIGEPRATRAVAGACAGNHAAVVVPCHRVVRSDGGLGGYKWGLDRKRRLLRAEGAAD